MTAINLASVHRGFVDVLLHTKWLTINWMDPLVVRHSTEKKMYCGALK